MSLYLKRMVLPLPLSQLASKVARLWRLCTPPYRAWLQQGG